VPELKKPIVWPEIDCSGHPRQDSLLDVSWPTLYQDLQDMRKKEWTRLAKAYERQPDNFWYAWWWLQKHPVFWYFGPKRQHESTLCWERGVDEGLEFRPTLVDPDTRKVSKKRSRNTHMEVWVEVFMTSFRGDSRDIRLHDTECDTGGDTYEQAIVNVAREIYNKHGHDRQVLAKSWGNG
jgi:hypothetical protein